MPVGIGLASGGKPLVHPVGVGRRGGCARFFEK